MNVNQIRSSCNRRKIPSLQAARSRRPSAARCARARSPEREKVVAKYRDLVRKAPGDPVAGQKAFTKVCGQCHKIYGEGVDVGPDVTSNGRSDFEQLLSNIFDPSLVIGASYQATTVATDGGRVLTGLLAEDSPCAASS